MADFAGAIDFDCTAALLERNDEEEGGGGALTVAGSDEASWPSDLSCFDFFFFFFGFSPLKTSSPLPMMRVVGGWLVWYGTNREGWRKVVGDGGAGVGCDARRLGEGIVREPH